MVRLRISPTDSPKPVIHRVYNFIFGGCFAAFWLLFLIPAGAEPEPTPLQPPPQQTEVTPLPGSVAHTGVTQSADPGYVLQPNDYVEITVYQEDDLTTSTRVSPEGNIVLPLIGTVKVGGSTVAASAALIRTDLMNGYIRDPKVVIRILEFAARRFSVLGEVQKAGTYEIPQQEQVTLLDAIAEAGGYTPLGDATCVSVRRTTNGRENIYTINAKEMAQQPSHEPFYVLPGDVVTVIAASRLYFSVLGEVQKPGSYEVPPQTTVTILDAIAQAGGYTKVADPGRVSVRRTIDGKESVMRVNAKAMALNSSDAFYIKPGDVITVAESLF